uniref:ABC transporter domain-containing protein n=1 Tax=Attheya septentrionalis TaxID=420275 RepID=A0A7S2XN49_9STRA
MRVVTAKGASWACAVVLVVGLSASSSTAFSVSKSPLALFGSRSSGLISSTTSTTSTTTSSSRKTGALLAKPKKKKALVDFDFDALDAADEPLSKKEQMKLEKTKTNNNNKKPAAAAVSFDDDDESAGNKPMSKKELKKQMIQMAKQGGQVMELDQVQEIAQEQQQQQQQQKVQAEQVDVSDVSGNDQDRNPNAAASEEDEMAGMSKKEQKAFLKKKEKKEEKQAARMAKKNKNKEQDGDDSDADSDNAAVPDMDANGDVTMDAPDEAMVEAPVVEKKRLTLEEKIRKERPPPRIRVMESAQPNFSSLRLENVGITFRDQEVLKDVTWGVQTGDRIGLVGANGAGKTTQLRIMSGEMEPTTGDVVKSSKDLRVAILRQEFVDELVLDRTLKEEFMSVFEEENKILQDLRDAESELEQLSSTEDPERMQQILDSMQRLQGKADAKDVYSLESKAKKVMDLMGFTTEEGEDLVSMFSGGWKMRIGLGKVLLQDPNILLLDEPTNHLDLQSVEWLEAFLRNQNIPMVIVSHDREFLDQVCTKIVDAEGGICNEYDGNYSRFLDLKKARMDAWQASYDAQEKKMKEERAWINKFKVKQPQAVKQRKAKLEKQLASDDYVKRPPTFGKPFRFRFPDAPRLSPEVAEVKDLSHSYGNEKTTNKLFDKVNLFIERGDRIAVLGPNGSGKSTLLRIMMGKEDPDEGSAEIIGQNVVANYFEQNQADALDLSKTVVDTVQGESNNQSYNELRALLGQFLFKGDAVEKKVEFLSGGEKARLSLCCMMLRPANLLILDEPTNHLDIPAKEMLEEALQHFQGSVIVISHDRYFISKCATTIVAIEDKALTKYAGDYKFYMDKSEHVKEKVEARYVKGVQRIGAAPVIDIEELTKPKRNFGGAKTANQVTRKDKGIKNAKRQQPQ